MEKLKRRILKQAKSRFTLSEYRRYFRAFKTLETHEVEMGMTLHIQSVLFDILPEFNLMYTALFQEHSQISEAVRGRFLNRDHRKTLDLILQLRSIGIMEKDSEKEMLHFLFSAFTSYPKILYFFLADQFACSKRVSTFSLDAQLAYAKQLFNVVAPLAKRMGIRILQEKFETIAFSLLFPKRYENISSQRSAYATKQKLFLRKVTDKIRYSLKKEGVKFHISSRIKNFYSIYKKLKKKGRSEISVLNDIFALRIIVSSAADCYSVLGIIHQKFLHVPGKIKDYISLPKPNSYQSLHTVLQIDMDNRILPFEVQIRTQEMDIVATSGMAAHMFYKTGETHVESQRSIKKKISRLSRQFSATTFLHSAEKDLFNKYIFVFTSSNEIFPLEKYSTVLDFAFLIHSDIGIHCKSAIVNGEHVALDKVLNNGDQIEIVTSDEPCIKKEWESMVYSQSIKKQIIAFFTEK